MTPMAPSTIWGDKLEVIDKNRSRHSIFNLRLKKEATNKEKQDFEAYVMYTMGGDYFLTADHPDMKEPYYTWEGKVVEKASLKGRGFPTA